MRRNHLLSLALSAMIALTGACGSGGATTTGTTGSITLSLSPTSATIQQGASAQVTGTIVRSNFTGDVAISVSGAPSGVTGNVTLAPVNGGNSAQVTLSASSSTVPGTYTLTVTASGSGISNATATFTLTVTQLPSTFSMAVSPSASSIAQGGSVQLTGTVVRTNFTGDIAIGVTGAPTGVTTNVTLAPINGGNSTQITVSVSSTAAPGQSTLTITATGGGNTITNTVNLTVTVAGSFTLTPSAATLSVTQGSNATTPVTATRSGGFAGTLVYSTTGPSNGTLPTGLTAAVTPTGTADLSTLTVTATSNLALGTYTVVVHATAFGLEQTEVVTVTVAAAVHLDYSLCSAANTPIWVAYQDGTGAFTRVTGTGNVYNFGISSSKGALATVTFNGAAYITSVSYFSQGEFAAQSGTCATVATGKTISGSVSGISGPNNPEISMGGANAFTNVANPNFQLTNVPSGVLDLIAYNRTLNGPLSSGDMVMILRDLNLATGSSVGVLNFATATPVATSTINVTGGAVNSYFVTMNYLSGVSCASNQINFTTNGVPSPFTAFGVPVSLQRGTDFHNLFLQHINGQADTRTVSTSFNLLGNKVVAIGAGIGTVTTTVLSGTYGRLQAALVMQPDYSSASFSYSYASGTFNRFIINQSAGYLAGASAVTMTPPDLTSVSGYLLIWGPATTGALQYTASVSSTPPATMCAEGATLRTASASLGGA